MVWIQQVHCFLQLDYETHSLMVINNNKPMSKTNVYFSVEIKM